MRYQIREANPKKRDIPELRLEAFYKYENYLIENHGFSVMWLKGGIGSGSKIHRFRVLAKIEDNRLYVADCMSLCGSQKWSSSLRLFDEQDAADVNCKKCGGN